MKSYLVASIVLVVVALCFILENHPAHAVPYAYNNTAFTIPWNVTAKTSNDYFFEPGYNGTITSWYRLSSSIMQKQLGSGLSSFKITIGTVQSGTVMQNASKIYISYLNSTSNAQLDDFDIITDTKHHDFASSCVGGAGNYFADMYIYQNFLALYCLSNQAAPSDVKATSLGGNITGGISVSGTTTSSDMKYLGPTTEWFNDYSTGWPSTSISAANLCEFVYTPTNATIAIDNIACDKSIPNHATHYWHGFALNGINAYATNSTYPLIQSVLSNQYKTMLTMDGTELGIPTDQFTDFIMHTPNGDYMFVVTSSNIYDAPVSTIKSILNSNRATQTYFITDNMSPTNFPMINNAGYSITFYGPAVNTTQTTKGVVSLVSPFTMTTTGNGLQPNTNGGSSHVVRTIDPQWTNDNNVYPVIETGTGQSMFQTFLTVSNAPTDGAIKATNPYWTFSYTYEPNLLLNSPFSSNTIDLAQSLSGHIVNGPLNYVTISGKTGFNVTSSNNYVFYSIPSLPIGNAARSININIYVNSFTAGAAFVSYGVAGSENMFALGSDTTLGGSTTHICIFSFANDICSATVLHTHTWYNIVGIYDGGTKFDLYINGVEDSNFPATIVALHTVKSFLYVGTSSWNPNESNQAIISSTKIYNIALNSAQVAQLYSTGTYTTTTNNYGEDIWAVTRMDSTRSAEYDILPNQCQNIYMADISVKPTVFIYQGSTCPTGANAKTIAYTASLPVNFYSFKYGASDSYVPSTNTITTMTRSTVTPFTYTVIVKNSTGAVAVNQTYTTSSTLDTRTFNVTGVTKPASLSISVAGSQIYSSYLGSPVSLSSVASFFHQYFSYDGFDFLSFLPIMFAGMFTRNTVGIGVVLTVVMIATLSWLSVVVVPDTVVFISIIVAVIGLVGYRGIYG